MKTCKYCNNKTAAKYICHLCGKFIYEVVYYDEEPTDKELPTLSHRAKRNVSIFQGEMKPGTLYEDLK